MTQQRKIDMARVWRGVPSADLVETKQAQRARTTAPLVSVGHVHGNVITINSASGLDLSQLLSRAALPESDAT